MVRHSPDDTTERTNNPCYTSRRHVNLSGWWKLARIIERKFKGDHFIAKTFQNHGLGLDYVMLYLCLWFHNKQASLMLKVLLDKPDL